jgi:hypothetical protein
MPGGDGTGLQVGRIYAYDTRDHERGSRFTVLRLDEIGGHPVVSVAVTGLALRSPSAPGGIAREISHLPIALEALRSSSPTDTGAVTDVAWPNDGYDTWMAAVRAGKAGFWTQPLAKVIATTESALSG